MHYHQIHVGRYYIVQHEFKRLYLKVLSINQITDEYGVRDMYNGRVFVISGSNKFREEVVR